MATIESIYGPNWALSEGGRQQYAFDLNKWQSDYAGMENPPPPPDPNDIKYYTQQYAAQQPTMNNQVIGSSWVNSSGAAPTVFDPSKYDIQLMPAATNGADNKYEAADSWLKAGAYYDPSRDYWNRLYYIPKEGTPGYVPSAKITNLVDLNPDIPKDNFLDTYLPLLALGVIGGGALGMFGGAGAIGGEAAALGAAGGETLAGGATLADLYGAATGMSAAAAPTAATGSLLYGAATGAIPAAVGGASTLADLYSATTSGGSNAMDWSSLFDLGYTPDSSYSGIADLYGAATEQSIPQWSLDAMLSSGDTALYQAATSGMSALDLIKQYGQTAAKALGMTKPDGSIDWGKIAAGGLSSVGGMLSTNSASDALKQQADTQLKIAEMSRFRPVGVSTRFGQSQFGYDANGNLSSAGYNLAPDVKAQQDTLMGMTPSLLSQYQGAQAATAPMAQAAQSAMNLGQGYLGTSPQDQAAKYMAEQQALLAAPREADMAALQARLQATGRGGLMVGGGTSGALASNPELNAYYNSIRQQDLGLAAKATQGGMDYAKFGTGMVGAGSDLLNAMYGTQKSAYDPYKTAMGGATYLEGLGQQAMDTGVNIGAQGTASNAPSMSMLSQAAQTMQQANAPSPWGALLSGAGNAVSQYTNPQQPYKFDPFTVRAL